MKIVELKSELLTVKINTLGAELISTKCVFSAFEFIWQANPNTWKRHAPILFPIVGKLKNNTYTYQGNSYCLSQHGFARDMEWEIEDYSTNTVTLSISSTQNTRPIFPFEFKLSLQYTLTNSTLTQCYTIVNNGIDDMYCSIGAHPGFNAIGSFTNYNIQVYPAQTLESTLLEDGLIGTQRNKISDTGSIQLKHNTFENDALVFENICFEKVALMSLNNNHSIEIEAPDFPFWGIWAPKNTTDFICLEPWCGIADAVNQSQDWVSKKGLLQLKHNTLLTRSFNINFQAPDYE